MATSKRTVLKNDITVQDPSPFSKLVGEEIAALIFELAPRKVQSRIGKALDHYTKAGKLLGGDEEMGVIRCIAAEEELVVAIFEWLKLNSDKMPEHGDFVGRYKNHRIKLAFSPVLAQMRFILEPILQSGLAPDGFEGRLDMQVRAVRVGQQVKLRLTSKDGKELLLANPLDVALTLDDKTDAEVVESIYEQLRHNIEHQQGMTVREYVTARAEFRNMLLYSEDAGFVVMGERLQSLLDDVFGPSLRDLLWCLAILMSDAPITKDFGLVSQFISVYRRVLTEAKL